eukprot:SAG31_NODE_4381_length_3286_cov_2.039536_1_plen_865_part_10
MAQPYSESDITLVAEILSIAQQRWDARQRDRKLSKGAMSLMHVLRAYEAVLLQRGISPDDDTYYYRFLLKLSLDYSTDDWTEKFEKERYSNDRKRIAGVYARSSRLRPTWDAWVQSNTSRHGARSGHQQQTASPIDLYLGSGSPDRSGVRPASPTRLPDAPRPGSPAHVIRDMESWVGEERAAWNIGGVSPRRSPPLYVGSPSPQAEIRGPWSPPSAQSKSVRDITGVDDFASGRNGANSYSPLPLDRSSTAALVPMSPADTRAYQDFKLCAESFRKWQTFAIRGRQKHTEQARALELYIDALNHWAAYQMSRILRGWSSYTCRRGRSAMVRHRRQRLLFWAWRLMLAGHRVAVRKTQALEAAAFHWAHKNWKTCFRHWKHVTHYERELRIRLTHPVQILAALLLRRSRRLALVAIPDLYSRNYALELTKPTRQKILRDAQAILRRWFAHRVLDAWVTHMEACLRATQLAAQRWKVSGCQVYMMRWKAHMLAYIDHRESMAIRIRLKRSMILVRLLTHELRAYALKRRDKKERVLYMMGELGLSKQKVFMDHWRTVTMVRLYTKEKITSHLDEKYMVKKLTVVTAWYQWSRISIRVAAWAQSHRMSLERAALLHFFTKWMQEAKFSAHLQQTYVRLIRTSDLNCKRKSLSIWNNELRARYGLRHHLLLLLRSALHALHHWTVKIQHLRRLEEEVVILMLHKTRKLRLRQWMWYTHRAHQISGEADIMAARRRDHWILITLKALHSYAQRKIQNRLRVERRLLIMWMSLKGNVLEGWAAAVQQILQKKKAQMLAVQHWAIYKLNFFLQTWRVNHVISAEYSAKTRTALQLWAAHAKMHCMTSWIFYVHGRRLAEQWMHNVHIFLMR